MQRQRASLHWPSSSYDVPRLLLYSMTEAASVGVLALCLVLVVAVLSRKYRRSRQRVPLAARKRTSTFLVPEPDHGLTPENVDTHDVRDHL